MRVDEFVDHSLIGDFDFLELQAHAMTPVAPGDAALGIDVPLRTRQPESEPDLRAALEWARGADGDAAATEVQCQRRGDCVAESVGNGNAEHDARAAASVEVVGKQMRRERRKDVLHRAVFVDVAGHAESRKRAHFLRCRDRAAEHQDRQTAVVELSNAADEIDASGVWEAKIDDQQIELSQVGADPCEQLGCALHGDGAMAGGLERGFEPVAHECRIVGDEYGFSARGAGHHAGSPTEMYRNATRKAIARVGEFSRYSL